MHLSFPLIRSECMDGLSDNLSTVGTDKFIKFAVLVCRIGYGCATNRLCLTPKTNTTTTVREESLPQRNGTVERQLSAGNSDDKNADRTSLASTSSSSGGGGGGGGGLGSPMSTTSNGSSSAPELNSSQANCPVSFLIVYHRKMVPLLGRYQLLAQRTRFMNTFFREKNSDGFFDLFCFVLYCFVFLNW